jgi:hypothetical protein
MAEGPPRLLGIVALPGIAGRNLARYDRASRILTTGNKLSFGNSAMHGLMLGWRAFHERRNNAGALRVVFR